jgi:hypothetical protein
MVRWAMVFSVAWLTIGAARAQAQNRGVYPLGMSATNSGVTPASGFTYGNQLLFYARNSVKDNSGETLPIGGLNTVAMDMNSFIWVSTKVFWGARYSATATIPVAKNDLTSDVQGRISGGSGLADSYFLPAILAWDADRVAVRAMYGFLAPTGRFNADASDNVGSGYWTHTLSSGQTFQVTKSKTVAISAFEMYEFHSTQEGTGIHPGGTFDLDYSLLGAIVRRDDVRVQLGPAGYLARQTTAKTGPNLDPALSEERYAVNSLGLAAVGAFPKHKANVTLKYFKEFANRATYQGYSVQVAGAISF